MPAWPLELLRNAHPEWADAPVVVVANDRANAELLFLDPRARALGLTDRMRLGTAQGLAPSLRSGVVDAAMVKHATSRVLDALRLHTPRVEASDVGIFFADPSGLVALYGSDEDWAMTLLSVLSGLQHRARIVVGYGKHRTRALASTMRGTTLVVRDEAHERSLVARLPLESFGISPSLRDALGMLGIRTAEGLASLPQLELAARFGSEALELHRAMNETLEETLAPTRALVPTEETTELDPAECDVERLLFLVKAVLDRLLRKLRDRGEAATHLTMTLTLDHAPDHLESLEPSAPTTESPLLIELIRLRLDRAPLAAAVTHVTLRLEGIRNHGRQLDMLGTAKKRDLEAAARAIARLHATFGPSCTSHIAKRDAHLPESRFFFAPTRSVKLPRQLAEASESSPLVRRVLAKPRPLDAPLSSIGLVALHGPYRIDGRWWARELARDYYYAETERGTVLWLYRDGIDKRWFIYGEVD